MNDDSFALAQRLLTANWDVVFLDTDSDRLKLAAALKVPPRSKRRPRGAEEPPIVSSTSSGESKGAPHSPSHASKAGDERSAAETDAAVEVDADDADASLHEFAMPNGERSESYVAVETVERVSTRLVTPVQVDRSGVSSSTRFALTESGSARAHDSTKEALLLGYEAQLGDVTPKNTDAVVIFLASDSQAFALANLLLESLHVAKVVCRSTTRCGRRCWPTSACCPSTPSAPPSPCSSRRSSPPRARWR